ncbi:MAG: hypothetical protein ABIS59_02585 [Candidatus Saccharibacteria bacterium]
MPSKKSVPKKSTKQQLLKSSSRLSRRSIFAFIGIFALVGTYLIYRALASGPYAVPTAANQIVLSYALPHQHAHANTILSDFNPDAAVLYGNGLLLCSDPHAHENHTQNPIRTTTLTSSQVSSLISDLKTGGFFELNPTYSINDLAISEFSTSVTVNLIAGAKEVRYDSGTKPTGLALAEATIQSRCNKAGKPYLPSSIVVNAHRADANDANVEQATYDGSDLTLPDTDEVSPTLVSGALAKSILNRTHGSNRAKFTKNGTTYAASFDPVYPTSKGITLAPKQKPGTAVAASAMYVRWYWFYPSNQAASSNTGTMATIRSELSKFYAGQVYSKVSTLTPTYVLKGAQTDSWYRACHTTACNNYVANLSSNCPNCNKTDAMMYLNIKDELTATGKIPSGQSVNVLSQMVSGYGANYCSGIGGSNSSSVLGTTSGFSTSFSSGLSNGCPSGGSSAQYWVPGHELGHTFALAHTCGEVGSIMDSCNTANYTWPSGYHVNSGQRSDLNLNSLALNQHITGRMFNSTANTPIANATILTCLSNPSSIKTDANGNFDLRVGTNVVYCLRVSAGAPSGYKVTTTNNSEHSTASTYESQVAGANCYHNTACTATQQTWDRNSDVSFNFTYSQ